MLAILQLSIAAFQAPTATENPRVNGSMPYPTRNGVTAPIALFKPEAVYTDDARNAGVKGEVRLRCVVDEKGVPTNITVVKSLYPSLDKSAIDAVAKWRFKPGVKAGQPAAVEVLIDVSFHPL